MRVNFTIKFNGSREEIDATIEALDEPLTESGLMYDEDYEALLDGPGDPVGFILHSFNAVKFFVAAVEEMNLEMIEVA